MPNSLRTAIIIIVAIVWAANFIAPIFVKDYKPTPELNIAFMAVMGVLTASYNKDEKKKTKPGRHSMTEKEEDEDDNTSR